MKLTIVQKIILWLAGYDSKTAIHCTTSEINKICICGSMVLIPGLVGLFSYSYGFYFVFKVLAAAIAGGIVMSFVLVLIDRSLLGYGRGKFSIGMIGRLLMAMTAGFLLAEPVVLKVFEDSIEEQQYGELKTKKENASVSYINQVAALEDELNREEKRVNTLQAAYTVEADGTGGSGEKNQGPIYEMKKLDYENAKTAYDDKAISYAAKIQAINEEKDAELQNIKNANADGLIGRMRALSALGEKETVVKWTTWLLRIFFCLIELLPLLIKISPAGDRGLYNTIVDIADREKEEIFQMSSEERKAVRQQEEKLRYTEEYARLCMKETQVISSAKEKDTVFLMDSATALTEKKLDFITKATKNIKDPVMLQSVINHLNRMHEGFMATIEMLLSKSNKNFGANNA